MRKTGLKAIGFSIAILLLGMTACRSGVTTGVGVDETSRTIKLGELTPLTGPVAIIGKPLTRGHEVFFKYVNDVLGGIGKNLDKDKRYKVELVTKDTQYTQEGQVQQYNAIKDQVLMIAQSLGTPTTKAILPQINEDKILTGAATLASAWLKEKYVIPAGAPYPVQFINAAQYLKDQGGTPKIGIIYQEDDYGEEGLKGLEYAASKLNFTILAKATYKAADAAGDASLFLPAVKKMKDAGVDTVFLTSTPSATGKALGVAAAALKYAPRWIGQSPSWIGALAANPALAPYLQQTMWVVTDASCGWGEIGAGCEGMKEMLDNIAKYAPDQKPDYFFIFGYTQARIVYQILEKAVADGDLTRDGVVKAFESLRNVDMGGLLNPISYGSKCEDKVPVTASTIWSVDPTAPVGLKKLAAKIDSPLIKDFPFCS
jgi:ABC-type branched-subunit amino acid transport system substrate-binding protein